MRGPTSTNFRPLDRDERFYRTLSPKMQKFYRCSPTAFFQDCSRFNAGGTASGYTAQAVQFSGKSGSNGKCAITRPSLVCTNNGFLSWAGWFKITDWTQFLGDYIWIVDSQGAFQPGFHQNGVSQWTFDPPFFGAFVGTGHFVNNGWTHIMCAADINHPGSGFANPSNKKVAIYANGMNSLDANDIDNHAAETFNMNGKDFWLGDDGFGDSTIVTIADFSFWPGINFATAGTSTIPAATIALFYKNGKPVNPSVAISALGQPPVFCTGGLSGFLANTNGTSGALSVPVGYDAPVNTADHP